MGISNLDEVVVDKVTISLSALIGLYYAGQNLTLSLLTLTLMRTVSESWNTKKDFFFNFHKVDLFTNHLIQKVSSLSISVTDFERRRFFQNVLLLFKHVTFNADPYQRHSRNNADTGPAF